MHCISNCNEFFPNRENCQYSSREKNSQKNVENNGSSECLFSVYWITVCRGLRLCLCDYGYRTDFRVCMVGICQCSWKFIRNQFSFLWWRIGLAGWIKCHKMTTSQKLSVLSKKNMFGRAFSASLEIRPVNKMDSRIKNVNPSHVGTGCIVFASISGAKNKQTYKWYKNIS